MTELPKGWASARLEDVASWSSGGTPKAGTPEYYGGGVPWAVIGDLNDGPVSTTAATITDAGLANSSAKVVAPGTVLVAMYGSIGKLGTAEVAMATNQAIACAVPNQSVTRDWLFWWMRFQREELLAAGKGGTQSNISQSVLKAWPIPVAPLDEQERIVAAIEEAFSKLDAGEAGLRNVRQLLKRTRDAILAAAVTGRLVPQDPTDTPATRLLADLGVDAVEPDDVPDLPDGWAWAELGSIATMSLGKMLDAKAQTGLHPQRYLRNVNVRWFAFDLDDVASMDIRPDEAERVTVRTGDLVVCEGGVPGRCAVWRQEPIAIQKALHRVRPAAGASGDYLALVLAWWAQQPGYERFITGTTIKHIPKEKLRLLPVPLPPDSEQRRIVAEVERQTSFIEACERSVDAGLAVSAALRRSVLKAAFEGRLVPQDPTDEPASVLLERIRAERAAAPKAKGRRATATP